MVGLSRSAYWVHKKETIETRDDEEELRKQGKTYSSLRSLGVMIGYLGFKLPPPCIFPRISSERVSWLFKIEVKIESKTRPQPGR